MSDQKTIPHLQGQEQFVASDSEALPLRVWRAARASEQGNIILLHGFNEYSGAFDSVGKRFAELGFTVWAYDQRGFGASSQHGLWSSTERMVQDLQELAQLLRAKEPKRPLYVIGFSMGGAVTLAAAKQASALPVDGLILAAPAVWARKTQPFYQRWGLAIARRIAPGWKPTGEGLKRQATDNVALLREIWRSPLMIRETRMDTLNGLVNLMDKAYEAAPDIRFPTLLMYGGKDQIVPKRPVDSLWQLLPKVQGSHFAHYPEGWHMLMRDLNGNEVITDVAEWMRQQAHHGVASRSGIIGK